MLIAGHQGSTDKATDEKRRIVHSFCAGLKVQEEEMLGLANMAEDRQKEAKQEIDSLLAKRSELLENAGSKSQVFSPRSEGREK